MLGSVVSSLFGDLDVEALPDAPLGPLTWYGIGGRADLLIKPRSIDALATLAKRCHRSQTPLRVLGAGANLLVDDEGVDGVVVRLDAPAFTEIKYNKSGAVNAMHAMAGADLARTLMDAARRGLDGLSALAGIPASVGGALRMNAGGAYGSIGEAVRAVACITRAGEVVHYEPPGLRFLYRQSNIVDPIILSATFHMRECDPVGLRQRVKEIFNFKKSTQPLADHSAGCTFKNPIDPVTEQRVPAGKLIDEAGLKGRAVGGVVVSDQHANFIIARAGATAHDVLELIELIEARVFDVHGMRLERELVVWKRTDRT